MSDPTILAVGALLTGALVLRLGIALVCWVQDRRLTRHTATGGVLTPSERRRMEQLTYQEENQDV